MGFASYRAGPALSSEGEELRRTPRTAVKNTRDGRGQGPALQAASAIGYGDVDSRNGIAVRRQVPSQRGRVPHANVDRATRSHDDLVYVSRLSARKRGAKVCAESPQRGWGLQGKMQAADARLFFCCATVNDFPAPKTVSSTGKASGTQIEMACGQVAATCKADVKRNRKVLS